MSDWKGRWLTWFDALDANKNGTLDIEDGLIIVTVREECEEG